MLIYIMETKFGVKSRININVPLTFISTLETQQLTDFSVVNSLTNYRNPT
jgi:hypothetical protein